MRRRRWATSRRPRRRCAPPSSQSRYRPRAFPLRPARVPRSRKPPFRRCRTQGHPRRRRALDLGPRRRVFPQCDPDRRHLPRQKTPLGHRPRPSIHPGPTSPRSGRNNDGTNSMPAASAPSSPPSPTTPQPATRPANASTISSATVSACAIPRSGPAPVRRHRRRRSGLQTCRRGAPQPRRNALVRHRRQCHPRPALLHPQRQLRSLLGTTKRRPITLHSQI